MIDDPSPNSDVDIFALLAMLTKEYGSARLVPQSNPPRIEIGGVMHLSVPEAVALLNALGK